MAGWHIPKCLVSEGFFDCVVQQVVRGRFFGRGHDCCCRLHWKGEYRVGNGFYKRKSRKVWSIDVNGREKVQYGVNYS